MGRTSEMESLVDTTSASREARERTRVILLTLAQQWSVQEGYERLGVGRSRFQALRRRMLDGAAAALEARAAGRPALRDEEEPGAVAGLRRRVAQLQAEVERARAELALARSAAGPAIEARLLAKAVRR